jgi:uncharacterized protein (TIGR02466 family)
MELLSPIHLFSAPVYVIEKPEYLTAARSVSSRFIKKRKCVEEFNPAFPVYMTESIYIDSEISALAKFISQTAWDILSIQGYAMEYLQTYYTEMWCQEHHSGSFVERHIHNNGSILSGFYFIDCPKDCCKIVVFDPRDAKVITSLPEKNPSAVSHASNLVSFDPKEGDIMFTNSWLPHSFTKNLSADPMRFIHFNIAVAPFQQTNSVCRPSAEVI